MKKKPVNKYKKTNKPSLNLPDIKYLNIPNICFSLTDKEDKREVEYSKQRIERGFDDSETWDLENTIASFIIPRLKRFKEINDSTPSLLTIDEWNIIIDKIIIAFELITKDDGLKFWDDDEKKQVNEGLDLFRDWLKYLWW